METKGLTCKIPLELHNKISEEMKTKGMTMSKFVEMLILEHYERNEQTVGNTRTLAFQVSEDLFQKVKEYLTWHEQNCGRKITQKEFMIGLIEDELERVSEELEQMRTAREQEQTERDSEAPEREEIEENKEVPTEEETTGFDEESGGVETEGFDEEETEESEMEGEPENEEFAQNEEISDFDVGEEEDVEEGSYLSM